MMIFFDEELSPELPFAPLPPFRPGADVALLVEAVTTLLLVRTVEMI